MTTSFEVSKGLLEKLLKAIDKGQTDKANFLALYIIYHLQSELLNAKDIIEHYEKQGEIMIWECLSDDDFIIKSGDYTLRVEQMDFQQWWYQVYFKGQELILDYYPKRNAILAKQAAINLMNRHRRRL